MSTPQVFDPFASDYVPRVDNGEIARLLSNVETIRADLAAMQLEVAQALEVQKQNTLNALAQVEQVIGGFSQLSASTLLEIKKEAREEVRAELQRAKEEAAADEGEEEDAGISE